MTKAESTRILLSFVGDHDPGDEHSGDEHSGDGVLKDGPLPSVFRHLESINKSPDKVVLFYTPEYQLSNGQLQPGMEKALTNTSLRLSLLKNTVEVVPEPVKINPASESEVLKALLSWLNTSPLPKDADVHINLASGTPAMRAVWTFLIDTRFIANAVAWNSYNPYRPFLGERVYPVGLSYLDETRYVYTTARLMKAMAFAEASDALKSVSEERSTTQRVMRAKLWQKVLSAYASWDRSFCKEAEEGLRKVTKLPAFKSLPEEVQSTIEAQCRTLGELKKSGTDEHSLPFLLDIYASLSRRKEARHYANVGTRTRRILEGTIKYAISQDKYAISQDAASSTVNIQESANDVLISGRGFRELYKAARNHLSNYSCSIFLANRSETWKIQPKNVTFDLQSLGTIGRAYDVISDDVNKSLEIHGYQTPDHATAMKFIAECRKCLSLMCIGSTVDLIPDAPALLFGSEEVIRLADVFLEWV